MNFLERFCPTVEVIIFALVVSACTIVIVAASILYVIDPFIIAGIEELLNNVSVKDGARQCGRLDGVSMAAVFSVFKILPSSQIKNRTMM